MASSKGPSTIETLLGPVAMDGELPTKEAATMLLDQLDFQQASQTYLWALPLVTFAQWKHVHEHDFGAQNGDIVYYSSYEDKLGLLLANPSTPYLISFLDLSRSGPMAIEIPEKEITGMFSDSWQRGLGLIGLLDPNRDAGGRFLVLPPGAQKPENTDDFKTLVSTTMNVILAIRVFETDPKKSMEQVQKVKLYPFAQRDNPPATRVVPVGGKKAYMGPPKGIGYWQRLHAILQDEVVEPRDRFFMAMLHNLGIDKGRSFDVTERQHKMLLQSAEAGELLAKALAFSKDFENARHWPDRKWKNDAVIDNDQQAVENYEQLNERSAYFYHNILFSNSIAIKAPAMGHIFLGAATDSNGSWLKGSKSYTLHLPPNPPVKVYWSLSIYDAGTRTLMQNEQRKADIFSKKDDILLNKDGSMTFYFGPKEPKMGAKNWLQTVSGRQFLVHLRLYYPLQPFFDKSWKPGDLEELY